VGCEVSQATQPAIRFSGELLVSLDFAGLSGPRGGPEDL